ncbi:hypothetical protein R3O67_34300 [Bacillus cereus]|uniref:hypothetical protein n=1 Tax=Bacillus cereus TaxID=1396 RepID=UPI00307A8B36
MYTKEQKILAIVTYLTEGWDEKASVEYRIEYMKKEAMKYAKGHPEWSDIYGHALAPIDDVGINELRCLIDEMITLASKRTE